MKKFTGLIMLVIATCLKLQAQHSEGNPFARLGYKADVYTFGEKEEFHDQETIVEIGEVLFNTKTNEVVGFVNGADSLIELKPELQSMSIDPHCEKYYSISPYAYCMNNPVKYIDPNGKDAVLVVFPDYKISTPIGKMGNLGHAGVLLINNKTGLTKYYEYGRYDKEGKGEVRNIKISNVKIDKNGKPTTESLNKVMGELSKKAGQNGRIDGAYIESDKFENMDKYATIKENENSNPSRKTYSLTGNNCGTFAADVVNQDENVNKKAPIIVDPRPNSIVEEYQDKFKTITYNPNINRTELK
ncbi:hypothetical protein [Bacteroides salyersiae]|uniref:hypothetical protein n=1 Tax=Bacteroides salyersiae TaxID=291644 RepID=UPI000326FB8C|nr:hypothetical protein [Bacteroides salyersiae]EOA51290.1 hypothetical protein HMPREF1532_01145 [Bacteroides salyersiae WAL 10018 = DSM 18765 = JCM 12988]MCS3058906.1 hypothetical protein [Bacteroides salyersiae]